MPWRIPRARCPRRTREVRTSDLAPIPAEWVLADETPRRCSRAGAPTPPPASRPAPTTGRSCAGCTRISADGTEKRAPMLIIDIIEMEGATGDCHLTHSLAAWKHSFATSAGTEIGGLTERLEP